jgi:hypothetical protein
MLLAVLDYQGGIDSLVGLTLLQPIIGIIFSFFTVFVVSFIGLPIRLSNKINNWWREKFYISLVVCLVGFILIIASFLPFLEQDIVTIEYGTEITKTIPNTFFLIVGWFTIAFGMFHLYPPKRKNKEKIIKHAINDERQKIHFNSQMLNEEWDNISEDFHLIVNGGWANEKMINFINYVKKSKYSSQLYPGTSLGVLLISKPENGKLNFQRTLAIDSKKNQNKVTLKYTDWDTIETEKEDPTLWEEECDFVELEIKFEEFMKWNKYWC